MGLRGRPRGHRSCGRSPGRCSVLSDTWQLVINTGTTIVTFLMVFLIQNTQNRDPQAIQLKLDELIRRLDGAQQRRCSTSRTSRTSAQWSCSSSSTRWPGGSPRAEAGDARGVQLRRADRDRAAGPADVPGTRPRRPARDPLVAGRRALPLRRRPLARRGRGHARRARDADAPRPRRRRARAGRRTPRPMAG